MNNFSVIYKILHELEKAMDCDEFDIERITPEILGVTKERRDKLLIELQHNGYIDGITTKKWINSSSPCICEPLNPSITLKGLEYLNENSFMKKAANLAKGIKEILPGI